MNIQRLTEEDSNIWFDMCGWRHSKDKENGTVSSEKR